jgi:hypothetical protein
MSGALKECEEKKMMMMVVRMEKGSWHIMKGRGR